MNKLINFHFSKFWPYYCKQFGSIVQLAKYSLSTLVNEFICKWCQMSSLFLHLFMFLVVKYWSICCFSFNTCFVHLSFSLILWYNVIDFLIIYLHLSYLYNTPPLFHCLISSLIVIFIQALFKYLLYFHISIHVSFFISHFVGILLLFEVCIFI